MSKESDRPKVCDAYREYLNDPLKADLSAISRRFGVRHTKFYDDILSRELVLSTLNKLENTLRMGQSLRLICCCAPKACHGN
eukprot:4786651-Karenia_brevis.AAC.1